MKNLSPTEVKRLNREWRHKTEGRVALLLDSVQTPYNVGAIVRTAAAERVEHLWFTAGSTPPRAPGVAKTALGTDRYLTWTIGGTGAECIAEIKAAGWTVVGVELTAGAAPLHELGLADGPTCLAIGHEDRGLGAATLGACDAVGFVPQLGRVGSLNVAVATAIALYETRRQEWASGS